MVEPRAPARKGLLTRADAVGMSTLPAPAGGFARRRGKSLLLRGLGVAVGAVVACLGLLVTQPPVLVSMAVLALVLGALWLVEKRLEPAADRWLRGARGEEQVAEALAGLEAEGWRAIHDVSLGRGNVDHVVIGPAGVFTIETKACHGTIDADRVPTGWWSQAYAEAKLVERIIGREVEPLLVISGGWTRRPLTRRRGVLMLNSRLLAGHLRRRHAQLSEAEVAALHARLEAALSGPRSR